MRTLLDSAEKFYRVGKTFNFPSWKFQIWSVSGISLELYSMLNYYFPRKTFNWAMIMKFSIFNTVYVEFDNPITTNRLFSIPIKL